MTNTVAFPRLFDAVFTFNREAFAIPLGSFELSIKWYGLIIAIGFSLAVLYACKRAPQFGMTSDNLIDILLIALPVSIIGARAYYVVNSWSYYREHLNEIFHIWEGGLAIYGAVIAAFLTAFIYGRIKKTDFLSLFDLGSLGFLIGQIVGRWANFVNAEAFGGPTNAPWGMSINGGAPVHPTFLYESLWNLIGFACLHFYSKRRHFKGEVALLYFTWYGLGRFFIEGLRTDSLYLGATGIRISQLFALISFVVCLALWVYLRFTRKTLPGFLALNAPEEEQP